MLSTATWVLLAIVWISIYYRRNQVKKGLINEENAHNWAVMNLAVAVFGLLLSLEIGRAHV
mgnify:CR=1 FL=1